MNSRRSFFKRLASMAAIVALAPQLAFRTKPLESPFESETDICMGFDPGGTPCTYVVVTRSIDKCIWAIYETGQKIQITNRAGDVLCDGFGVQ